MARIKLEDLPAGRKLDAEEMKRVFGGISALNTLSPKGSKLVSPIVRGGIIGVASQEDDFSDDDTPPTKPQ